ncbi:unnamed protein product [Trichogramma brassicae]|uniref:Uncharacterized protein n=1 Tax=Trichogramma brassicae TaxID=86971 RepID=A0A6H5J2T2_9HYME|nr:unnamed protein product [Trichogramma brassicae]
MKLTLTTYNYTGNHQSILRNRYCIYVAFHVNSPRPRAREKTTNSITIIMASSFNPFRTCACQIIFRPIAKVDSTLGVEITPNVESTFAIGRKIIWQAHVRKGLNEDAIMINFTNNCERRKSVKLYDRSEVTYGGRRRREAILRRKLTSAAASRIRYINARDSQSLRCVGNSSSSSSSKGCGGENSNSSKQPLWGQIREDTLLPPSRRNASSNASTPTSFDGSHKKRNSPSKKWSIDGLFKRVSSLLDHSASVSSVSSAESSSSSTTGGSSPSSSLEELPLAAVTSNFRGASEYDTGNFPRVAELDAVRATRPIVWISAPDSTGIIDNDDATMSSAGRGHRHQRSSAALLTEAATAAPHNCCCSCGSSSPNNGRRCKGPTKARVESRRSSVIADCSSSSDMDESGGGGGGNGSGSWRNSGSNNPTNKRRSRASRTERYLKRQCGAVNGLVNNNGGNNDSTCALECHSGSDSKPRAVASRIVADSNLDRLRPPGVLEGTPRMLPYRLDSATRPRSEVPEMPSKKYAFQSEQAKHIYALPSTSTTSGNGQRIRSGNSNSVSPASTSATSANGANNPLVQQTLQYFSRFNDNDNDAAVTAARIKPVPKPRKLYPHPQQQQQQQKRISAPPVPPSRDSSSSRSLLVNGLPIDRYNDTILQQLQQSTSDKENNSEYSLERHSISSPSCEVRLINEGRLLLAGDNGYGRTIPLRDTRNNSVTSPARLSGRVSSLTQSPSSLGGPPPPPLPEKPKYSQQSQSRSQPPLQRSLPLRRPRSRQDSANLESALEELETIFNSLHLDADEQLLDRAERRTLEEMHYRGLTASPVPFDAEDDPIARRKTWADSNLLGQDEVDRAAAEHRLRDDMAFRRMQSANRQDSRPASSCAGLESISYLMTPVPFGGENSPRRWEDATKQQQQQQQQQQLQNGRKKRVEPDVTLDDVVFRMRHHANNTLKIADPQPPFGIPLGPIATATESDYLHSQAPSCSPASGRSAYIPSREPDLVTDDLAYRALRKDASSACSSHHHHHRRPSQSSPMSFCSPVPSTPSPLHFGSSGRSNGSFKKRHRSLSSNLYGVISSSQSPTGRGKGYVDDDDNDDDDLDSCRSGSQAAIVSDSESLGFTNDSSSFRDATSGHVTSEEPCPRVRVVVVDRQSSELDLSSKSCEVHRSEDDVRSKDRSRSGEPTHDNSSASFATCDASVAGGSAKARNTSPEETTTAKAEPENSAYKKLCQDLENLVQLTKGIDSNVPASTARATTATKSVAASNNKPTAALRVMSASEIIDGIARDDDKDDQKEKDEEEDKVDGQSTIKREISTVLDDLKNLRETCREDIKRCRESELLQPSKPIGSSALESSSSTEATTAPTASGSAREKCDNRDNSSKAFMRSVREAKLAGDWKESTPRARTDDGQQLTISDDDPDHPRRRGRQREQQPPAALRSRANDWEGERAAEASAVVTCSLLGTVLSRDNQRRGVELFGQATAASARLTAKCIRHITNNSNGNGNNNNNNNNNNLTAQCCCCILLVFFLVLLIAIQYVP